MTIQKTAMPCLDEETKEIENTYGYIINLIANDFFPITITGIENRRDLKRYFLQTCNKLFDKEWNEYENRDNKKYVYQYEMIS